MFTLILECADHLEQYLDKVSGKDEPVECRELTAKYTTDVIGSCAFGIEMNALTDEDSEFRRVGRKVFAPNITQILRFRLRQSLPWLYNLLGYILPPTEITTFFTKTIVDTMKYRDENKIERPDFVNMLMELKKHPDKLENISECLILILIRRQPSQSWTAMVLLVKQKLITCIYIKFN